MFGSILDASNPGFIALFMFLVFLVYGGWVIFRRPRRQVQGGPWSRIWSRALLSDPVRQWPTMAADQRKR